MLSRSAEAGTGPDLPIDMNGPGAGLWIVRAQVEIWGPNPEQARGTAHFVVQIGNTQPVIEPEAGWREVARIGPELRTMEPQTVAFVSPGTFRVRVACQGAGWVLLGGPPATPSFCGHEPLVELFPYRDPASGDQRVTVTPRGWIAHATVIVEVPE